MIASQHGMHLIVGGFPNRQPNIYQDNHIYGFSCPAFETGITWIFFNIKQCNSNNNNNNNNNDNNNNNNNNNI